MQNEISRENNSVQFDMPITRDSLNINIVAPILHKELIRFEQNNSEKMMSNKSMCTDILQRITALIEKLSPDLKVKIYGSFATALNMPWSDIDLVISKTTPSPTTPDQMLNELAKLFQKDSLFFEVNCIPAATIPVLKAVCTQKFGYMKIDVTVQEPRHNGLKCVELVNKYLLKYRCLKYLVLPLKQFIFNSELNDPYQGGLTSYGLILMIVAFLQLKIHQGVDISSHQPNLGLLLIEFLNFYMNFDYKGTLIKPAKPDDTFDHLPFEKIQPYPEFGTTCMHITDPLNKDNNVSRSAHRFYILRVEHFLHWVLFCILFERL